MSEHPVAERGPEFDRNKEQVRRGGCTCSAVRFEVRGEPLAVGLCHCTACRKETGSAYVWYADWPRSAFACSGEVREFNGRSFCPACGSRLFHLTEDEAEIMLGSLDEVPGDLRPTREGWIRRREHWLAPVAGADQFDRDPT